MKRDFTEIDGKASTSNIKPATSSIDTYYPTIMSVDNNNPVTILNNASNRFEVNEKHNPFNTICVHNYSHNCNENSHQSETTIATTAVQCAENDNTANNNLQATNSLNPDSDSNLDKRQQQTDGSQTEPEIRSSENIITPSYTSTEAQTDFLSIPEINNSQQTTEESRQRRRRQRRERRHQRRFLNNFNNFDYRLLPDLLNANTASSPHIPPPPYYSTLPLNFSNSSAFLVPNNNNGGATTTTITTTAPTLTSTTAAAAVVIPNSVVPFHLPGEIHHQLLQGSHGQSMTSFRFQFPSNFQLNRARFGSRFGSRFSSEDNQKSCCGLMLTKASSLRYFIALIALTAVCCVLIGTVLGGMRPTSRDHLTVSLLMIGVGIIMIAISGITWRLTTQTSAFSALFGFGSTNSNDSFNRHFTNRLLPSYGRPHHPYAAMIYPEFMYRPPPPSYQASMQEYRLRLLLLERGCTNNSFFQPNLFSSQRTYHNTPPPTYRSHTNSILRTPITHGIGNNIQSNCSEIIIHNGNDQNNSISNNTTSMVNVVNILTNQDDYNYKTTTSEDDHFVQNQINPLKLYLKSVSLDEIVLNENTNENNESKESNNLITIVQTNDQNPVIVTVSGPTSTNYCSEHQSNSLHVSNEMQILAHL